MKKERVRQLKISKSLLAGRIEQIILRPDATQADVGQVCREAIGCGFHAVCVNSANVKTAAAALDGSGVKVCVGVGFPLGAQNPEVKAFEAQKAVEEGAYYIDTVINVGRAKQGQWRFIEDEIAMIAKAKGDDAQLKVILETCLLTDEEKINVCKCAKNAGADFVKTSTGFSFAGATLKDVALMAAAAGETMKVKAAGGIRDAVFAIQLLEAGAYLLGTSRGPAIIDGYDDFINSLKEEQ